MNQPPRGPGGGKRRPYAIFEGPWFPARPADLDIDFAEEDRVRLACRVVANSLGIEPAAVFGWSLNRRLGALAAIAAATLGDRLAWQVPCPSPACRQLMELDLKLDPILSAPLPAEVFEYRPAEDICLTLRLPTGWDQQGWRDLALPPEERSLVMAGSLVVCLNGRPAEPGWRMPEEWLDGVEKNLSTRDPFTVLDADLECPSCGARHTLEIDLESVILEWLALEQRRATEQVHRLARAYHWNEAEVLAIPAPRRAFYLQRSEAEG